jgi:hypothetical protein
VNPTTVGWPSSANTGPPDKSNLKHVDGFVATKKGARYDELFIDGCVDIQADDVAITRSVIRCSRNGAVIRVFDGVDGLVLDQVEIDGLDKSASCLGFSNFTVSRSDIHGCNDGIDFDSGVTIESCYIHDLARGAGTHNDALQTTGGRNDVIKDNTLEAYNEKSDDLMNAAIQTGHLSSDLINVTVDHNYMDGGNYTVNAGSTSTSGHRIEKYVFINNVFGPRHRYGPVQAVGAGTSFDDTNVWAADGTPVRGSG